MNEHGRVDVRDNAGLGTAVPALKESPEDFRRVVHTNHSAHWMAKERAAVMGPGSSIVNIASILVLTAGFAPQAAYSSSKAAVLGLTRDLAAQWGSRLGIRVNAIAPGYVSTDINSGFFETKAGQEMLKRIPQRRLGDVEDLYGPLLLLASDAGRYMTGSTIAVDGGHLQSSL